MWYCEQCDEPLFSHSWQASALTNHQAYIDATQLFNTTTTARTCSACGHAHSSVDVSGNHWAALAEEAAVHQEHANV